MDTLYYKNTEFDSPLLMKATCFLWSLLLYMKLNSEHLPLYPFEAQFAAYFSFKRDTLVK